MICIIRQATETKEFLGCFGFFSTIDKAKIAISMDAKAREALVPPAAGEEEEAKSDTVAWELLAFEGELDDFGKLPGDTAASVGL